MKRATLVSSLLNREYKKMVNLIFKKNKKYSYSIKKIFQADERERAERLNALLGLFGDTSR